MGVAMNNLAPHLTAFLQEHLPNERRFSRHTVQSYTDCFRLLVVYAARQAKTRPSALKVEQLTVTLVVAFLESLEKDRHNCVGTRNIRLAAIKSFFRYLEYRVPSCLDLALQIRAIRRNAPRSLSSTGLTEPRCRRSWMRRILRQRQACETAPCCTCAMRRRCGCRN